MNIYRYRFYDTDKTIEIEKEDILEADARFKELTGIDPRGGMVAVSIVFGK